MPRRPTTPPPLPLFLAVPPALSVPALRDALEAAELPAKVSFMGLNILKAVPGRGTPRQRVEDFIRGFVAGFNS